jgi:hypothetical protein
MSSSGSSAVDTAATALSAALWELREALDQLLFKVFETRLVLAADADRWLASAGRELDAAGRAAREVEVLRAMDTVVLADALEVPPSVTLGELSGKLPAPWDAIFADHLEALRALSADIAHEAAAAPAPPAGGAGRPPIEGPDIRAFVANALADARPASLLAFLS